LGPQQLCADRHTQNFQNVSLGLSPVTQLFAGGDNTCTMHEDGRLRCWGRNLEGQLGNGNTEELGNDPGEMPPPFVDVAPGFLILDVVIGARHICVLTSADDVRCWGGNAYGQLGDGTINNRGDGPGEMPPPAVDLGGPVASLAMSANGYHTCAVLQDNTVRCWGRGDDGALGYGSTAHVGDAPGEMPPPPVPVY
jgi:alpha-tubulin suppressor-like RCC1 family protein